MKFPAFWTEFEELINPNRIRMKNVDRIKDIVVNLIDGGPNRLQIVSDYDRTISKQYDHHKDHISSFGNFFVYFLNKYLNLKKRIFFEKILRIL